MLRTSTRRLAVTFILTGLAVLGLSGCVFVPGPGYATAGPGYVVGPPVVVVPRPYVVVPGPVYGYRRW